MGRSLIRTSIRLSKAVVGALFIAACNDVAGVEVQDLVGQWTTTNMAVISLQNTNDLVNLGEMGWTANMDVDNDGVFTLSVREGDGTNRSPIDGRMEVDGHNVTWTIENKAYLGEVWKEHEQISYQLEGGYNYDFNGDGTATPAKLSLVVVPR
jgi:hypothetical protein